MTTATATKFDIKKFKKTHGMEGPGFICDVYMNGRKAFEAADYGDGGPIRFRWYPGTQDLQLVWDAHVAGLPEYECEFQPGQMIKPSEETAVARLVDLDQESKQLRRWCKTQVVLKLKSHKEGQYLNYKGAYTPAGAEKFRQKYGEDLAEIVNERFL